MKSEPIPARNHNEEAVYEAIGAVLDDYPAVAKNADLLADVTCVALNRLPPRYIRHAVDYLFYLTDRERQQHAKSVREAVRHAFEFVQARAVVGARS
ncbi:MAG: late competence development ComFB family protein [Rubrivivax sp.]|nr:late competence development ComFB family protein [Rubrivivax sp.]